MYGREGLCCVCVFVFVLGGVCVCASGFVFLRVCVCVLGGVCVVRE